MKFSATVTLQYPTVFSPFSVEDWLKGLDWMRDNGLDGAELCISHYNGLDLGFVKAQLDERGLGCNTLSTGQARGLEGLSLIGVSREVSEKTRARLMQHVDAAAVLGSKVTIGLMRGIGSVQTMDADLDALAEAMKPLVDYADQKGVVLLLEACPCAAITSVFAVQYHHEEDFAGGLVVVSTLLSVVTLPVVALLLAM